MATLIRARGSRDTWPLAIGPLAAWTPLIALPVVAILATTAWPAWTRMWLLAVAIYASFKWLSFATSMQARTASLAKSLGYLFLWTGMDADAFFRPQPSPATQPPRSTEWLWSLSQLAIGLWLLLDFAPHVVDVQPYLAGWIAMTGIVSVLHFGVSHLASLVWRTFGVNAHHIMHKPLLARSVSDFWGQRWNLAFRDVMHNFVFRPLAPAFGVVSASMATFVVSGLIHDAVISFTARGGWGLPTLYFLIQAAAVLFERSRLGRQFGLGRGFLGWLFAFAVIALPAGLLFHAPFIHHVVVPMIHAIQDFGSL